MYSVDGLLIEDEPGRDLLPVPARPEHDSFDAFAWARRNRGGFRSILWKHRALLLRNIGVTSREAFSEFVGLVAQPIEYMYRSSPRKNVGRNLYTATEYPSALSIPLHCENSYQRQWPLLLFFYCEQLPLAGGETPLADVAAITREIDKAVAAEFAARKVMYVRNYSDGLDLPWQEVFQTNDRAYVHSYCRMQGMTVDWRANGSLRTSQVRPAFARHPQGTTPLWFNQAHLFHVSALDGSARQAMLQVVAEHELPRQSLFGDGGPIDVAALEHIRAVVERNACTFAWQANDVLVIDNMAVAHGRRPYQGSRRVLVMMADRHSDGR